MASILELLPTLFNDHDHVVRSTAAKMFVRHVLSDMDIEDCEVRIDEQELPSLDIQLQQQMQRACCMLVHCTYTQRCVRSLLKPARIKCYQITGGSSDATRVLHPRHELGQKASKLLREWNHTWVEAHERRGRRGADAFRRRSGSSATV